MSFCQQNVTQKEENAYLCKRMQNIKNIIFDLGGVLVGLDGLRSIEAFDALGCQAVSRYIEEHRTEDLF